MAVDSGTFLQRLIDSGILTEQNLNAVEEKKHDIKMLNLLSKI